MGPGEQRGKRREDRLVGRDDAAERGRWAKRQPDRPLLLLRVGTGALVERARLHR